MAVSFIISDSVTLVENRDFCIPAPHLTPLLDSLRQNIAMMFGAAITSMVCLPDCVDTLNRCDRVPACDRQTDRHLATA